jgi:SAM-dependent methyltransferase
LAQAGAQVVGVDIAEDGLVHARATAAERGLEIDFVAGDAQELSFEDGAFDGVASAFGVMFAPDRERAAGELARVCRSGGKLGLTLMPMDSRAGETFSALERRGGIEAHPARWSEDAEALLGGAFEIESERRDSSAPRMPSVPWDESIRTFEPLRKVVERLDDGEVATLRAELEAVDEHYRERAPSYFVVLGRRR